MSGKVSDKLTVGQALCKICDIFAVPITDVDLDAIARVLDRTARCRCMDTGRVVSEGMPDFPGDGPDRPRTMCYVPCDNCELGRAKAELQECLGQKAAFQQEAERLKEVRDAVASWRNDYLIPKYGDTNWACPYVRRIMTALAECTK